MCPRPCVGFALAIEAAASVCSSGRGTRQPLDRRYSPRGDHLLGVLVSLAGALAIALGVEFQRTLQCDWTACSRTSIGDLLRR